MDDNAKGGWADNTMARWARKEIVLVADLLYARRSLTALSEVHLTNYHSASTASICISEDAKRVGMSIVSWTMRAPQTLR